MGVQLLFSRMQGKKFIYFFFWVMIFPFLLLSPLRGQEKKIQKYPYDAAAMLDNGNFRNESGRVFKKLIFEGSSHLLNSQFVDTAYFYMAEFWGTAYLNSSIFEKEAFFTHAVFKMGSEFVNVTFKRNVDFVSTNHENSPPFDINLSKLFKIESKFLHSKFSGNVSFAYSVFSIPIDFSNTIFDGKADFQGVEINSDINFTNTKFGTVLSFYNCNCNKQLKFPQSLLPDTLILSKGNYPSGVDLRDGNYQKLSKLYIENISFIDGEFLVYWDQIKMRGGNFRISYLGESTDHPDVAIEKLKQIYVRLYKNYIKIGDEKAAYDVMFEFEQQKERLSGELLQKLSGITFGYGYKPKRFIMIIFLIMIMFVPIYYFLYYDYILIIFENKLIAEQPSILKKPKSHRDYKHWKNWFFDHTIVDDKIPLIYRIWHSILFSASVLLSLRFKKDWVNFEGIKKNRDTIFIVLVIFEYFVGLSLYYLIFRAKLRGVNLICVYSRRYGRDTFFDPRTGR